MNKNKTQPEEKIRWGKWYLLVLLFLLAEIVFFYYITNHFACISSIGLY
ncbi:MAG: hypothetical protein WCJ85_11020 [Chitinophagaceae bacterium]